MSTYRREIGGLVVSTSDDEITIRHNRRSRWMTEGVRIGISIPFLLLATWFGILIWRGVKSGTDFGLLLLAFLVVAGSLWILYQTWSRNTNFRLHGHRMNGMIETESAKALPVQRVDLVYAECNDGASSFTLSLWDKKREQPLWSILTLGTPDEAEEVTKVLSDFLGTHRMVKRPSNPDPV